MADHFGRMLNPSEASTLRPELYLGNMSSETRTMTIWDINSSCAISREIKFNRGLYNIVREIISNAIDNVWRSEHTDTPITKIEFNVDLETNFITVTNDGVAIPIQLKEYTYNDPISESQITKTAYPAEVFFGYMFAGTNYDDESIRKTSGRNGIGATLCVIMSEEFTVDHTNSEDGKRFIQTFSNNLTQKSKPKVTSYSKPKSYTSISFKPDFSKFGEEGLWEDLHSLFAFYAREVAAITGRLGVTVRFNGQNIRIPTWDKFAKCLFPHPKFIQLTAPMGDECIVIEVPADSVTSDNVHQHSYVNGCATHDGGAHVDAWRDALIKRLVKAMNARKSTKTKPIIPVTAKHIYPHLHFLVRADVDRPKFENGNQKDRLDRIENGQKLYTLTSESMTAAEKKVWTETLSAAADTLMKWPMIKEIDTVLRGFQEVKLNNDAMPSNSRRLKMNTEYYVDAPYAGKKGTSHLAILKPVEGLSAKTLVIAGIKHLPEEQRNRYGILPLKGKVINAGKKAEEKVLKNKEIADFIEMMRLRIHMDYSIDENFATLRYGHIELLTDADDDGWHIKGLILTFLWTYTPTLFNRPGFINSHNTPTVKVNLKKPKETMDFYSYKDYLNWASDSQNSNRIKGKPTYIKGLGSTKREDAPALFDHPRLVEYYHDGDEDDQAMTLAFKETKAGARYQWLTQPIDQHEDAIVEGRKSLSQFVNQDVIHYYRMTFRRALPCLWDGFKESTRKIFFTFRKKSTLSQNCEKWSGAVGELANYHHGLASLRETILSEVMDFVGANNINWIVSPSVGQGSRLLGGKDHGGPRYVDVKLGPWAALMFPIEDELLLTPNIEDGESVEMLTYAPVLPMVLINESVGIATGCSTNIPGCNPMTVMDYCLDWIEGDGESPLPTIRPWYRGFTGTISVDGPRWKSEGVLRVCPTRDGWWEITELPIGVWTDKYIAGPFAKLTAEVDKKVKPFILKFENQSNDVLVHILFLPSKDFVPTLENMKLIETQSLNNLMVIDEYNVPRKFESLNDMADAFCQWRLPLYKKRREHQLTSIKEHILMLKDKLKYMQAIIDEQLRLNDYEDGQETIAALIGLGVTPRQTGQDTHPTFNYLLNMTTRSMTRTHMTTLEDEIVSQTLQFKTLKSQTGKDLWKKDIQAIREAWTADETERQKQQDQLRKDMGQQKTKPKGKAVVRRR